jgi:hypothetical protein
MRRFAVFFIGLFPAGFAREFCLKKKQLVSLGCVAAQLADFVKGDQGLGLCHLRASHGTVFWHDLKHGMTRNILAVPA